MSSQIYQVNKLALAGTNPVAYFTENRKAVGLKKLSYHWKDLEWRFTTPAYRELFIQSPEKYIPQYGGFCAFGISNGYKAKPHLSCFTLIDDKLYLNFSPLIKKRWLSQCQERILNADLQWEQVKMKHPIQANRHFVFIKYVLFKLVGRDSLA